MFLWDNYLNLKQDYGGLTHLDIRVGSLGFNMVFCRFFTAKDRRFNRFLRVSSEEEVLPELDQVEDCGPIPVCLNRAELQFKKGFIFYKVE